MSRYFQQLHNSIAKNISSELIYLCSTLVLGEIYHIKGTEADIYIHSCRKWTRMQQQAMMYFESVNLIFKVKLLFTLRIQSCKHLLIKLVSRLPCEGGERETISVCSFWWDGSWNHITQRGLSESEITVLHQPGFLGQSVVCHFAFCFSPKGPTHQ